jgi:RNA polymerase sigma factor (sigma-70 family)
MSDEEEFWKYLNELAGIAVYPVKRSFHKYVETEDLKQAALEYSVKRKKKIQDYLNRESKVERKRGESAVITLLRRAAERYARKEKAVASGYEAEDEYFYFQSLVENLIQIWSTGDYDLAGQVLDPAQMSGQKIKRVLSEGGNLLALVSDIDQAMKILDKRTIACLRMRFADQMSLREIAEMFEVTPQRIEQIINRGFGRIVKELGGRSPYGFRK